MSLFPVKKVLLVQDSRNSPERKLHVRSFKKSLKEAGFSTVEVFNKTSPRRFLKAHSNLYYHPSPCATDWGKSNYVVLNELGLDFSQLRKYLGRQKESAYNLEVREGKVCYPRIVLFKVPSEEVDTDAMLSELQSLYKSFIEAGVVNIAASEEEAIKELIELLKRIDSNKL